MNYSYTSTPATITTSTTETVVRWLRGAGGNGQVDRIASADPRDVLTIYGENTGGTDCNVQVYGCMTPPDADNPIDLGVPMLASPQAIVAGATGAVTLAAGASGFPWFAVTLDAASGTPTVRMLATVKSAS